MTEKYYMLKLATMEEWNAWEKEMESKHPIKHFFIWTLPMKLHQLFDRIIFKPIYYFKCKLLNRYNVVKCQYLASTWVDRDYLMLHCCFQILKDFVEKEHPWEFDASHDQMIAVYGEEQLDRIEAWKELRQLYYWWIEAGPNCEETEEVQKNLESLIKIRGILWS